MSKSIIFSGAQPTGNLHIGNYLGAVRQNIELQSAGPYEESYFFIADYHSLTGNLSPDERRRNIVTLAAELLAAGMNPETTTLFLQSEVMEHVELAWMFNCVTPVAELERMTQFKDKSKSQAKNINAGLFGYPVLQAADILLYHGTHVPVGEDQVQHVELTRDIARWFANAYGEYFPEVQAVVTKTARVKSLLEPEKKMSKSKGGGHVIELADSPEVIEKKIKKAVTASEGGKASPGVKNLLMLLEEFGDTKTHKQFVAAEKDGSIRYGDLKHEVSQAISSHFESFRARREELLANPGEIANILIAGADKARVVAQQTMERVREMVGIR